MVEIVCFDHTDHAHILLSCYRECPHIFNHSMVLGFDSDGKAQIEKSCKHCFQNNWQRPLRLEPLYQQRLLGRAILPSHDSSHPSHDLSDPLPSSRRFRSIKPRTNRFSNSFPPSRTSPVKTEVIFLLL